MNRILITLLAILCSTSSFAQNWKCFVPVSIQYFTNAYGYMRGMRIDSILSLGSSAVYCPYQTIRKSYYSYTHTTNEIDSTGGSWLGKRVVAKTDGSYLFDNIYGDTVIIKTLAGSGESWTFYNDSTNDFYIATVTATDTMSFLGITDSVKTIRLSAYQNGQYAASDSFNNAEIILSKHHGFVQVMDLYNFPYHRPDTVFSVDKIDFIVQRTLVNPSYYLNHNHTFSSYNFPDTYKPGKYNQTFRRSHFPNPSMAELNSAWNPGDILNYTTCPVSPGYCLQNPFMRFIDTIQQKNIGSGSIEYQYRSTAAMEIGNNQFSITNDTVNGTFLFSSKFRDSTRMPEEFKMSDFQNPYWYFYYYPDDSSYCRNGALFHKVCNDLYQYGLIHISSPVELETYKEGLGRTRKYRFLWDGVSGTVNDTTLKYFVLNSDSCGSSVTYTLPVTEVNTIATESEIEIYPNPSQGKLVVESDGGELRLLSADGRTVNVFKLTEGKTLVELPAELSSGMYILQYINGKSVRNVKLMYEP